MDQKTQSQKLSITSKIDLIKKQEIDKTILDKLNRNVWTRHKHYLFTINQSIFLLKGGMRGKAILKQDLEANI